MYAVLLIWKIKICTVITAEQQSVDKRKKIQSGNLLCSLVFPVSAGLILVVPITIKMYSLAAGSCGLGF